MNQPLTLTLDTSVVRSDRIMSSPVDNALVMMDMDGGKYFSLDPSGADIWARLAEPVRIDELCDQLTQKYAVTPEDCQQDVLNLLKKMLSEGLVATTNACKA